GGRRRVRGGDGRDDGRAAPRGPLRERRRDHRFARHAVALRHRAPDRSAAPIEQADAIHGKGGLMSVGLNELGVDERPYILAFDHRGSCEKMVGDVARVPGAKALIWEGFQRAVEEGAPKESAGILVDGQYGPDVARAARAGGYKLAMPVEKSGQHEFDF